MHSDSRLCKEERLVCLFRKWLESSNRILKVNGSNGSRSQGFESFKRCMKTKELQQSSSIGTKTLNAP